MSDGAGFFVFGPSSDRYVLAWGGNSNMTGRFSNAWADAEKADQTTLNHVTEHTIVQAGTATRIAWNSQSADGTSVMKLHLNGIVVATFTLTGLVGGFDLSLALAVDDELGLEYDAGTTPDRTSWALLVKA